MLEALVRAMVIMILAALSFLQSMPQKKELPHVFERFGYVKKDRQSFGDVPSDYWAYEEIELIYSYGITVGCSYDPPLYCPDRPATRAEMAVFAARLLELMEDKK